MKTLRKDLSIFALGGSNWVELRIAKNPPTAKTTTTPRMVTQRKVITRRIAEPYGFRTVASIKNVKKRILLMSTIWNGGRTLGTLTRRQYRDIVGNYPTSGFSQTVPHSFIPAIMGALNIEDV